MAELRAFLSYLQTNQIPLIGKLHLDKEYSARLKFPYAYSEYAYTVPGSALSIFHKKAVTFLEKIDTSKITLE